MRLYTFERHVSDSKVSFFWRVYQIYMNCVGHRFDAFYPRHTMGASNIDQKTFASMAKADKVETDGLAI